MNGVQCHPRPEIGRNSGSARRNQVGTRSESHWTKTSRNGTRTLPGSALSRNTTRQHHLDHVEPEPPPKLVPPGPTLIKFLLLTKMYSVKRCSSSERQRFRRKKGGTPVPLDGTSSEPVRNHLGTPLLSCITSSQPGSAFRNHLGTTSEQPRNQLNLVLPSYPPHYREASNVPFAASSTILYPQAHQRPSRLAFPHPTALEVVVNGGSLQAYHVLCKYPYCVG
jgi:hypothetical protein